MYIRVIPTDWIFMWMAMEVSTFSVLAALAVVGVSWPIASAIYSLYFDLLAQFPGPTAAGLTRWWKAWIECVRGSSFCHELERQHARYGPVVRIGPNELHFSDPRAYHDIYNSKNRWDKEERLYHSFGEDRASFGLLTYREAKARKDIIGRFFSTATIQQSESLLTDSVNELCTALAKQSGAVDMFFAYRCMTLDIITYLSFGKSVQALETPGFKAPFIISMDSGATAFIRFKYSNTYKRLIMGTPPALAVLLSPPAAGMLNLQKMLRAQIKGLMDDPERYLAELPHQMSIYHRLMDPATYTDGKAPEAEILYEEAQTLLFAGADTVGNALMVGTHHLLHDPVVLSKLNAELHEAWPVLDQPPKLAQLEKLPYLDAVIKESLRRSYGVVSGLPRIVPAEGAQISGVNVPAGTIVSIGSTFVHDNPSIFPDPSQFRPERWLENPELDQWLASFSRGPRMCLGINLAWAELRLTFSHVFRKFDMKLADNSPAQLSFSDGFLPHWTGEHLQAYLTAVTA